MNALFIIAPKNFRDEELFEPYRILETAGVEISVASIGITIAQGSMGGVQPIDVDIDDVNVDDCDAIIFVGGPGAKVFFDHPQAHFIAQNANINKKIVGAICIAPSILANAGILKNIKVTSFNSEYANIEAKGALIQKDQDVVVDKNIVTASGPQFAKEFGKKVLELMKTPQLNF